MADLIENIVKVGLIGGAAYLGYEGYKDYQRKHEGQDSRELRLKIASIHPEDNDITIDIQVLNPTSDDMDIQSFVGEMYAGNTVVADIQMFGSYTARANNEVEVPLIAKPKSMQIFHALQKAWKTGKMVITFKGTINVNKHAIPISLSYNAKS